MSVDPPVDPMSFDDAMMEASHLLDLAVSAALEVAGSGDLRPRLEAIAEEAERLRGPGLLPANDDESDVAR